MVNRDEVEAWIADEVDPAAAAELHALLDAGADDELTDRFSAPLSFGTAGLRGPLRAGPNGMNRTVVRRAAGGLAAWLGEHGFSGRPVVVGFDARYGSLDFATDSAQIFAAAGFDARLMPEPLPTPVTAFAVQLFGAAAGVVVTASHNPPQDNGYKVYADDGAQIVPPADREIEAAIRAVGSARDIPLTESGVTALDDAVVADYVAAVAGLVGDGPRDLQVVHTAMHGVGTAVAQRVFAAAGFDRLIAVPRQEQPDPDFPTVSFPNPEEPGALDLAFELARSSGADIVIANDPDADRCAVAVPIADDWRMLRGDEVGLLLADALMRKGIRGTYATTIVSSSMLRALATARGVAYAETLTGFKWISRAAPDLVYGYEEALGYAVAPALVRDKDGISAALLVAELAAQLKSTGSSLVQRLDELAAEVGRHVTDQVSVRVDDLARIAATMHRLRTSPPRELLGRTVTMDDLAPDADVLRLTVDGARVVVRPSGTEPKLKAYLEVVDPSGSNDAATARLDRLRAEVTQLVR
jgi:phosphomannomutase